MEVNYKAKWYLSTIILIQTAGMLNTLELKRGSTLCKYNFYFDHQWMDCIECPWGSFGANCSQQCVTGFYGRLCQRPCECNAQYCHPVNGCQTNVTLKEEVSPEVPVSSWLETSMNFSTLNILKQSEPSLDMSTLKMDNSTSKLSSPSSVSDGSTVQGRRRSTQTEAPTSIFESASSEKLKEITEFPTSVKPSTSSSTSSSSSDKTEQNNHWMLVALILIALIAASFAGGVFNALKPKCRMPVVCNARSSSQDHANVNAQKMNKNIQQRDTPRTYDGETQDYDEIQKSQLNQQLNPAPCTSMEFRRENGESEFRSSNSQKQGMYKRISFNCDYNILLLKQRQSAAIYDHDWRSTGAIFGTDEDFVTLIGGESLNLLGTAEDNIFQSLPGNFDFSRIKGEESLDSSHRLIQSTSESQLSDFKYAPNLSENGFDNVSNEGGLYCEKESFGVAEKAYSISQENIQREVQISEVEEFKPEIEITRF